jgi:sec-independent protein translocase protein TatA
VLFYPYWKDIYINKGEMNMFGIGPTELLVIFLVIFLLFGAKRLPELARSLGRSMNEFKQGLHSTVSEIEREIEQDRSQDEKPKSRQGWSRKHPRAIILEYMI